MRDEDASGISGTGFVAEGVEFSDGTVVIHWLSNIPSTEVCGNLKQCLTLHGHNGKTKVEWDTESSEEEVIEG